MQLHCVCLILYCHCFEILDNFIFDLVFWKLSLRKQWSMNERVCFPFYTCGIHDAPWAQNSGGPMMCGSSVRFKASTRKYILAVTEWNPNLFQVQKESNGILKNTNDPETLSYPFLLPNHFYWKWWHRKSGKDRATHPSFSSHSSLFTTKSQNVS